MYIGQKVEIKLKNDNKVLDADIIGLHENGILLALPREYLTQINDRCHASISYFENKTKKPKGFETSLRKKITKTNLALFAYPKKIEDVERRGFYRFSPWEEMEIHFSLSDLEIDPTWLKHRKKPTKDSLALPSGYKKAKLIDISGGGLAMAAETTMKQGKKIGIVLFIKDKLFKLNGYVVGCHGNIAPYKITVEFLDIKHFQRDRIVRFVFQQASGLIREADEAKRRELRSLSKLKETEGASNKREVMRLHDIAIPIEYKVVRHYLDAVRPNYKQGLLRNISITGASFFSKESVPVRTDIWLKLPLGENFVRVLGMAIRSRFFQDIGELEVGIKFKGMDVKNKKRLSAFIYNQQSRRWADEKAASNDEE